MFQSSCDHHQGVFLKTCFLKEVAKTHVSSIYLHESNLMESQQFLLRTYKNVIHIILA